LQTVTDFGQFSRSEVNPLLLDFRSLLLPFRSFLLGVSLLAKPFELFPHFLDGSSEVRKLTGDARDVLLGCHHGWILSPKVKGIHGSGPVDEAACDRAAMIDRRCAIRRRRGERKRALFPAAFRGGRYWARTSDPQLVELVLSQLS
jgi:hypothetical protein